SALHSLLSILPSPLSPLSPSLPPHPAATRSEDTETQRSPTSLSRRSPPAARPPQTAPESIGRRRNPARPIQRCPRSTPRTPAARSTTPERQRRPHRISRR